MKQFWRDGMSADYVRSKVERKEMDGKQMLIFTQDAESAIDKARQEGKDEASLAWTDVVKAGRKQGAEEERERIVKMVKEERTRFRDLFLPGIDHVLDVLGSPVPFKDDHSRMHAHQPPAAPRLPEKLRGPVYTTTDDVQQAVNALIDYLKARE